MGLGSLMPPNRSRRSPRAHPGALRSAFTAATVDKKARTRRRTLLRVGGGGLPQCNVPPEKHRPEACRTGKKLDQTESGGGRGVNVKSALRPILVW